MNETEARNMEQEKAEQDLDRPNEIQELDDEDLEQVAGGWTNDDGGGP